MYKPHNSDEAQLIGTSPHNTLPKERGSHAVGKWHPNRAGEFHSLLRGKQPFAFGESAFVYLAERGFFSRADRLF